MVNLYAVFFYRYKNLFKDDISATAMLAYFVSLNIFSAIGLYKYSFLQERLSTIPLFYSFPVMIVSAILTRYILISVCFKKNISCLKEIKIANSAKGGLLVIAYGIISFGLMLFFL